jgi:hypothetical protein
MAPNEEIVIHGAINATVVPTQKKRPIELKLNDLTFFHARVSSKTSTELHNISTSNKTRTNIMHIKFPLRLALRSSFKRTFLTGPDDIVTLTRRTRTGICGSLSRWTTSASSATGFHQTSFAMPFGSMPDSR